MDNGLNIPLYRHKILLSIIVHFLPMAQYKIDLSFSGIHDNPPPQLIKKIQNELIKDINFYPQNYGKLISIISQKEKLNPKNILLINGVDSAIDLLVRLYGQKTVYFPPTYYEFEDAVRRHGHRGNLNNASLILLCNPNNPFGLLTKNKIIKIIRSTQAIIAVDETYIDFAGKTLIQKTSQFKNLLVLRSFSKSYGLAGLRIGYIIGQEKLIQFLQSKSPMFTVSSLSVEIACEALENFPYQSIIKSILQRKKDLEKFLKNHGFKLIPSLINKTYLKFNTVKDAKDLYSFLIKEDIKIILGNGFSTCGLDNSNLQIVIGRPAELSILKTAIKKYVQQRVRRKTI